MFSSQPLRYIVEVMRNHIHVVVVFGGGGEHVIEGVVMHRDMSRVLVLEAALTSPTASLVQRRCLIRRGVHC